MIETLLLKKGSFINTGFKSLCCEYSIQFQKIHKNVSICTNIQNIQIKSRIFNQNIETHLTKFTITDYAVRFHALPLMLCRAGFGLAKATDL